MSFAAFSDSKQIAKAKTLIDVATDAKKYLMKHTRASIFIFEVETSEQIEIDFRGSIDDVRGRLTDPAPVSPGPGRPKLGVISKEVTLMPTHWEWLSLQPGGASVTLRRLVDEARKRSAGRDEIRKAQDAAYKFMTVMAGDLRNYEEALRALYAKDKKKFKEMIVDWPQDIRDHSMKLVSTAF